MPKAKHNSFPTNWPSHLPYLSTIIIAPSLPRNILSSAVVLTSPSIEPNTPTIATPQTPYTNIRITPITTPDHPAFEQAGLFTTRIHAPGEFICLYLGYVHSTGITSDFDVTDQRNSHQSGDNEKSDYDLSLDRDLGLAIDADKMGNEARFINDYRGVKDKPNAEFRDVFVKRNGVKERGVGVFVKSVKEGKGKKGKGGGKAKHGDIGGIGKGEEVLVSYGRGFWCARRTEEETAEV